MIRVLLLMLAALLTSTAAQAQVPPYVADPEGDAPLYKRKYLPPAGWMSDDDRRLLALSVQNRGWAPVMPETANPPEVVVIRYGQGGLVAEHNLRYGAYQRHKTKVEIRGPCYSACTLITAYIGKDDLCIAEGAFLGFHAVRRASTRELMPAETAMMYWQQPADIRGWIDRTGGHQNLPLNGYWPLHDRELWEMGYPRCK